MANARANSSEEETVSPTGFRTNVDRGGSGTATLCRTAPRLVGPDVMGGIDGSAGEARPSVGSRPAERDVPAPGRFPISPAAWHGMSAAPVVSTETGRWAGPLIRWWIDIAPAYSQPALDHHYLALHLGDPRRVSRRGKDIDQTADIERGAVSIVPAGQSYRWSASGPIDLAHIYLFPRELQQVAAQEFDRCPGRVNLRDLMGARDPLLHMLFLEMLEQTAGETRASRLYLDTLLRSLQIRLLRQYGDAPAVPLRLRHSIAPVRLRRVIDFIEANIAKDIALADLAEVASSSPFHFSRAFAAAMGVPPYAYLLSRRVEIAKGLLVATDEPMSDIARRSGFRSTAQFSRMFKQITGGTPLRFRGQ